MDRVLAIRTSSFAEATGCLSDTADGFRPNRRCGGCDFSEGARAGESECLHCGFVVCGNTNKLKKHVGACRRLPEALRRALDKSEVAKAAAGVGMYGSNAVYRGFQVTGWTVAQCRACLETVRGNSAALKQHKECRCRGFPATWIEVDVASNFKHFTEGKRAGERECLHCGAVLRGDHLKAHCRRLPKELRRALDKSEVARAVAGAGTYGSNPVYRGFQVTGWQVAQCKACLETVRGRSNALKQHKERCAGPPAHAPAQSHKRRRLRVPRNRCPKLVSAPALRNATRSGLGSSRLTLSLAKHGVATSTRASPSLGALVPEGKVPVNAAAGSTAGPLKPVAVAAAAAVTTSGAAAPAAVRRTETCHGAKIKPEADAAAVSVGSAVTASSAAGATVAARAVRTVAVAPAAGGGNGGNDSTREARHRWASGVRATRGSEAVVAAMRARYKRLYKARGHE